jgi:glutaredoxin-related protein
VLAPALHVVRLEPGPPQARPYVKGQFVGGCDIVTEMFQSGELATLLDEKGVEHKPVAA